MTDVTDVTVGAGRDAGLLARAAERALARAWLQDDPDAYRAGVERLVDELALAARVPASHEPPATASRAS